jgi:hypothetical protein
MKKFIFICFWAMQFSFAQDTIYKTSFDYEKVYLEVGVMQPLGNLKKQFSVSPTVGFWFRSEIKKNDYVDFGVSVIIPQHAENINYRYKDSTFSLASNNFGGTIGARFAKVFPLSVKQPKNNLEWNTGLGIMALFYDANHKRIEDIISGDYEDENHSYSFGLTSLMISQGVKINFKNVGLQCQYQFTPFHFLDKKLDKNFGNQSLMLGIYYRQ